MPFIFTIEDGTGLPTANSYVSVAEADDILVTNIHNTAWTALLNADKEKLLSWASRLLDTKARWFGQKSFETSGLRWPRQGVTDRDGIAIPKDEIPQGLKEATAELARFMVDVDRTSPQKRDGLERMKVDVIEIEFDKNYRLPTIPLIISDLVSDLGYLSTGAGGSNAAKIIRI